MSGNLPNDKGVCTLIPDESLKDLWVDCDKVNCPSFPSICCTKCGQDGIDAALFPETGGSGDGPTTNPGNGDTEEMRAEAIKTKLEEISFPITVGPERVKALDWITNLDPMHIPADSLHLSHRYILALLYYSLDGDNWEVDKSEISWLSQLSHCYWLGIECNIGTDGDVMSIDLGKDRKSLGNAFIQ